MSGKTTVLIIFLVIVTVGLTYVALSPKKPSTNSTLQPTSTQGANPTEVVSNARSILYFSPDPVTAAGSGTIDINIDTGGNNVTGVQLELLYEPTFLSDVEITPADFFDNSTVLINKIDEKLGRVSYALVIPPSGKAKIGQGTVAKLSFNTVKNAKGQTAIKFVPRSLVTAEGEIKSVLKSTTNATIILQ